MSSNDNIWNKRRVGKQNKLIQLKPYLNGKFIYADQITQVLQQIIEPGDKVMLEGNNQKQASFLSEALASCSSENINHLHMIISSISRPEHLDLFEKGLARKLDFSYAGPQSLRIAQLVEDEVIEIGAIHTYLELYARLFVDLTPNVVLVAAEQADYEGNLYTGPNTEETPTIIESAAFSDGIVIVQVNEIKEKIPRVDIPASWVDVIVQAPTPYQLEPLFTRDPKNITELQILMGMLAIRGVYEKHNVQSLNHGIGFNTAAIELLLPTYGEQLGLKGKICRYWTLNPHPTLIPAIESGWVEKIHSFGGEVGMEKYIASRPDIFFTGSDGSLRSNRMICQVAGMYGVDLFIGSTLQMDYYANSSTVTEGRLAGFGGAPNMGSDARGRRHASAAWLDMINQRDEQPMVRGKKIVVQTIETYQKGYHSSFVEALDAIAVGEKGNLPIPPVMIYGDDVTHVVTEEGIAYLYLAETAEERRLALGAIAGLTPLGLAHDASLNEQLREKGLVAFPEDLHIRRSDAKRSLLAAKSIEDLVEWSDGLYVPPAQFRTW